MPSHQPARRDLLALTGVTCLAAAVRYPWIALDGMWFDEVFSVVVASQSIEELLRRTIVDQTNPPGFYLLLSGWLQLFGYDLRVLRLLPFLTGVLVAPGVFILARALQLRTSSATVGGIIAASSPLLISMSSEVRAYSAFALLSTVGLILAAQTIRNPQSQHHSAIPLAAVNIALVMTHYFGAVAVIGQVAAVILTSDRPDLKRRTIFLAKSTLPAAFLLVLWLALVVYAGRDRSLAPNVTWIDAYSNVSMVWSLASAAIGSLGIETLRWIIAAALTGCALLALGSKNRYQNRFLAASVVVPVVFVLLLDSIAPQSLWVTRYMICVIPPLALLIPAMIDLMSSRLRLTAGVTVALWSLTSGVYAEYSRTAKPNWTEVVKILSHHGPATICTNEQYVELPLSYYAIQNNVPVRVVSFDDCRPTALTTWAVYRPETERSLQRIVENGGDLSTRFFLETYSPRTYARRIIWRTEP